MADTTRSNISTFLSNDHAGLAYGWHPIGRSEEFGTHPTRVTLLSQDWVVYRSGADVVAFEDRCPHRLAPLSLGTLEDCRLRCAYHGWVFDDQGDCVEIPALGPNATIPSAARLSAPWGVCEHLGMVFLAPKEPLAPLLEVDAHYANSFDFGELPPIHARASAGFMADNFLDIAHFPFLHSATFGADESTQVTPYEVSRDGMGFVITYEHDFANREDPKVATGERNLIQRRRLTYTYCAPFSLSLRIDFLDAGGTNIIGFFIQPVDSEHCRLYSALWRDDLHGDSQAMKQAIAFELAVIEEDLNFQASYRALEFPLDPTAEVHTRADKATLALRRILRDFVHQERTREAT